MSDTHEEWRTIGIVNGIYSVSNMGKVRNNRTGLLLKPIKMVKGYVKVNLKVDGKEINAQIHRLVATAFIPNPESKPEVNHKNGVHDDNRLSNLEWVTQEENLRHAYDTGLIKHKDNRYSGYLYSVWKRHHKTDMCSEWQDYLVFYEWCYDNGYTEGNKVCRYNTSFPYDSSNCYISSKIQRSKVSRDKRKRLFKCFGEMLTIEELSEKYNIGPETFIYRVKKGMSVEEAALKPLVKSGRPRKEDV